MENEKNIAAEAAENAEQSAEQNQAEQQPAEKTYTQSEVDMLMGQRVARNTAKIRKEYDTEYGALVDVLKAATGKETVQEITDDLKGFYQKKGVKFPQQKPQYSQKEIEVLARAEAEEIIGLGDGEINEELNRLTRIGADKMSAKDKAVFKALSDHQKSAEQSRELAKMGVEQSVIDSKEFKTFAKKFTDNTPITEIYDIYSKHKPKKELKTAGSMKSQNSNDNSVKDFYSFEEASKFTKADFDRNPELYKKVCESMTKW